MIFWASAIQVAAKLEAMRSAEARLMSFAKRFGDNNIYKYNMTLIDTSMPSCVLPLRSSSDEEVTMHGVRVSSQGGKERRSKVPLVLLHGYMNGALYFYRNLLGLSHYFETVFSLDMMGWGLSSRPDFHLRQGDSVDTAEEFFVESLEAWRSKNNIDKMILAGHSMGGYVSVAYCEKYPERVDRLILLSPVGVPEPDEQESKARWSTYPWQQRLAFSTFRKFFEWGVTPGTVMRTVSTNKGTGWTSSYIERRLPAISDQEEQEALTDYLYTNSILPGSGEHAINKILLPGVFARKPTVNRIPNLQVSHVTFLYGEHDWMDPQGGLDVQTTCDERRSVDGESAPKVDVFRIANAGHLLMLDNWEEFNSAVIIGGGGKQTLSRRAPSPTKLLPTCRKIREDEEDTVGSVSNPQTI